MQKPENLLESNREVVIMEQPWQSYQLQQQTGFRCSFVQFDSDYTKGEMEKIRCCQKFRRRQDFPAVTQLAAQRLFCFCCCFEMRHKQQGLYYYTL